MRFILVLFSTLLVQTAVAQTPTKDYIYVAGRAVAVEHFGCGTPTALGVKKWLDGNAQLASIAVGGSWSASANVSWITFPNGTTGTGNVCFALLGNDPISGAPRVGSITINGQPTEIVQRRMGQVFNDLPPETQTNAAFHYDTAHILMQKGITIGCAASPRNYCGTNLLQRSQMAVFYVRSWSLKMFDDPEAFRFRPEAAPGNTPYFDDVPYGHPEFTYIQKLYELGITIGCQSYFDAALGRQVRNYCPADNTINLQAAIFTVRARQSIDGRCLGNCVNDNFTNYPTTQFFADVAPTHPNFNHVQKLRELGGVLESIASPGCAVGYFCDGIQINRGEKARYIVRALLGDWNN